MGLLIDSSDGQGKMQFVNCLELLGKKCVDVVVIASAAAVFGYAAGGDVVMEYVRKYYWRQVKKKK